MYRRYRNCGFYVQELRGLNSEIAVEAASDAVGQGTPCPYKRWQEAGHLQSLRCVKTRGRARGWSVQLLRHTDALSQMSREAS
jgi:hypothetical protein